MRVWAAVDGNPDGICLDAEGAAWFADVPNRRCAGRIYAVEVDVPGAGRP